MDQNKIVVIDEFQRLNEGNTKLLCRYLPSPDREKVKWGNVKGKDVKKFEEKVEEFSRDKILIGKRINLEHPDITL